MDDKNSVELQLMAKLRSRRASLRPEVTPVKVAFLDAYIERMETLFRDADLGADPTSKGADDQVIMDLEELSPLVLDQTEVSAREAHSSPLTPMLLNGGYSPSGTYDMVERQRKAPKGRRPKASEAIDALELKLMGKSDDEIANLIYGPVENEQKMKWAFKTDEERLRNRALADHDRRERLRKLIETVEPIYEKYKPRK